MRKLFYIFFTLLLLGCSKDESVYGDLNDGSPVSLILNFGALSIDDVVVTKQTMPELSDEAKVWNLYVFIFDSNGNKICGRYFDVSDVLDSAEDVRNSSKDAWYVNVPS